MFCKKSLQIHLRELKHLHYPTFYLHTEGITEGNNAKMTLFDLKIEKKRSSFLLYFLGIILSRLELKNRYRITKSLKWASESPR